MLLPNGNVTKEASLGLKPSGLIWNLWFFTTEDFAFLFIIRSFILRVKKSVRENQLKESISDQMRVRWRQLAFLHFCPRALSAFSLLFDWLLSSSINLLVTFFTRCSFWPLATSHPGQWPPGHPGQWYSLGKPSIPTCVNPNYQIVSPEAVPVPIPAGGKKCEKTKNRCGKLPLATHILC